MPFLELFTLVLAVGALSLAAGQWVIRHVRKWFS